VIVAVPSELEEGSPSVSASSSISVLPMSDAEKLEAALLERRRRRRFGFRAPEVKP